MHYTKNVINCDIHTRKRTLRILKESGAERAYSLDQILTASSEGSGWNETYGLLGANKATEDKVKLFPRDCQTFVDKLQKALFEASGKQLGGTDHHGYRECHRGLFRRWLSRGLKLNRVAILICA